MLLNFGIYIAIFVTTMARFAFFVLATVTFSARTAHEAASDALDITLVLL